MRGTIPTTPKKHPKKTPNIFFGSRPGVPFGDEEGELISGVLAPDHKAALLAHHGLITCGGSIEEATYRAWFFERARQLKPLFWTISRVFLSSYVVTYFSARYHHMSCNEWLDGYWMVIGC